MLYDVRPQKLDRIAAPGEDFSLPLTAVSNCNNFTSCMLGGRRIALAGHLSDSTRARTPSV